MRRRFKVLTAVCVIIVLLPIGGLIWLSVTSQPPTSLGVTAGRLAPCPDSPNCVSSQATRTPQRIEPISFPVQAGSEAAASRRAMDRLADIVTAFPRAKVVRQTDDYLHAEFTSAVFRFVDDVEFHVDQRAGAIQVRSASRVGDSDLGANRRRVEAIRAAFAQ